MSDDVYEGLPPAEESPHGPGVLAMTDRPLAIEVQEIEADPIPEGMICIGTFIDGRMVARCVLPVGALEQFARHGFFTEPRQLVLAAREGAPGLRCELYAIVPLPPRQDERDADAETEGAEPWLAAADAQGYERAIRAAGADEDEDAEEGDDPESGQAAVLLGQIVRFEKDRKHPESLPLEAVDILSRVVQGKVVSVVDKVLEDLLGPGPA